MKFQYKSVWNYTYSATPEGININKNRNKGNHKQHCYKTILQTFNLYPHPGKSLHRYNYEEHSDSVKEFHFVPSAEAWRKIRIGKLELNLKGIRGFDMQLLSKQN